MSTSLWNFALELYARPGVEQACLRLQDAHGNDVCLLLCALWLDRRGVACTAPRREAVRALAGQWQGGLIAPLRALRRRWKAAAAEDTAIAGLRQRLAQLEVDAERELLARLEALCAPWPARETRPARAWLAALASPDSEATALARLAAAAGA